MRVSAIGAWEKKVCVLGVATTKTISDIAAVPIDAGEVSLERQTSLDFHRLFQTVLGLAYRISIPERGPAPASPKAVLGADSLS